MNTDRKSFIASKPIEKQNDNPHSNKIGIIFLYLLFIGFATLYVSTIYEDTHHVETIFTKMFNYIL